MNETKLPTVWKLVPVPATDEMVAAIEAAIDSQLTASGIRPCDMHRQDGDAIYAAAMAAAPVAVPGMPSAARDAALEEAAVLCDERISLGAKTEYIAGADGEARHLAAVFRGLKSVAGPVAETNEHWLATTARGETCGFGNPGLAAAWAGTKGSVRHVPHRVMPELIENSATPAPVQQVAIPELRNAFITLESKGGEGRTIVLKFNQRDDAYAVHHFLMQCGADLPVSAPVQQAAPCTRCGSEPGACYGRCTYCPHPTLKWDEQKAAPAQPVGLSEQDKLDAARLAWVEEMTVDVRCVDVPNPGGDDGEIVWVVIQHHMAAPHEREIGSGNTMREAIDAAILAAKEAQ